MTWLTELAAADVRPVPKIMHRREVASIGPGAIAYPATVVITTKPKRDIQFFLIKVFLH